MTCKVGGDGVRFGGRNISTKARGGGKKCSISANNVQQELEAERIWFYHFVHFFFSDVRESKIMNYRE